MTLFNRHPNRSLRFLTVLKSEASLSPKASPALVRCINMARRMGAGVEICLPCRHDEDLLPLIKDPVAAELAEQEADSRLRMQINGLIQELHASDVDVQSSTVSGMSFQELLQHKTDTAQPDMIFVEADDNDFGWGLADHNDWRLLRDCPVPIWFVQSDELLPKAPTVLAAVGSGNDTTPFTDMDADVLQLSHVLAQATNGENHAVHAVSQPKTSRWAVAATLGTADFSSATNIAPLQSQHLEATGSALRKLVRHLPTPPDDVHLCHGLAKNAVPEVAEELDADVVVLGAKRLGYWSRLTAAVTAEPILAMVACDVVYVPERPDPRTGAPAMQLLPPSDAAASVQANPSTPTGAVTAKQLSPLQKRRVLNAWAAATGRQTHNKHQADQVTKPALQMTGS